MLRYILSFLCVSAAMAQSNWTVTRTGLAGATQINGTAFGNARFVISVTGPVNGAAWSPDGITWHLASTPISKAGDVVFAGDAFYTPTEGHILRSTDGDTWTEAYAVPNNDLSRALATDGEGLMAGSVKGSGAIYLTLDGRHWTQAASLPNTADASTVLIYGIKFGFGRYFVAYDVFQSSGTSSSYVAATADGINWTRIAALDGAWQLAIGNGRVIVPANPSYMTSYDGENFVVFTSGQGKVASGLFTAGRFFGSDLKTSTDGSIYAPLANVTLPTEHQILGVAYGNGRYIAVGTQTVGTGATSTLNDLVAYLDATALPDIRIQPRSVTCGVSYPLAVNVTLSNADANTTYQWYKDSVAIAGATNATYSRAQASLADAGRYSISVHNAQGTIASEPAVVAIVPFEQGNRITNISVLTRNDETERNFILGFVLSDFGPNTKPVLVRAAGPSLTHFGVAGVNPNPRLDLYAGDTVVVSNDDWDGTQALVDYGASVGAFGFDSVTSKDAAAFYGSSPSGSNSLNVTGTNGATGAILAEVYEMAGIMTATTPRFRNVSVRKYIASDGMVTLGFVIKGATKTNVLIRAVGPGLSAFLPNPLPNPTLSLFKAGTAAAIAANDDWAGTDELKTTMRSVGAFDLDPASKDSALTVTLGEGDYTAQVTPVNGGGGVTLIEVYVVPQ